MTTRRNPKNAQAAPAAAAQPKHRLVMRDLLVVMQDLLVVMRDLLLVIRDHLVVMR